MKAELVIDAKAFLAGKATSVQAKLGSAMTEAAEFAVARRF